MSLYENEFKMEKKLDFKDLKIKVLKYIYIIEKKNRKTLEKA